MDGAPTAPGAGVPEGGPRTNQTATTHLLAQLAADIEVAEVRTAEAAAPAFPEIDMALLQALTRDMAAIQSASLLLTADNVTMAERVAIDLVKAQAWRATWLLRAVAFVREDHVARGARLGVARAGAGKPVGAVLATVAEAFASEARLNGIDLRVNGFAWNQATRLDDEMLVCGISGAVIATLGLIGGAKGAVVSMGATESHNALSVHVSQEAVSPSAAIRSRFFDREWTDRPGGYAACLGALVVKSAAERHGGRAALVVHERVGSIIELQLRTIDR